MSVWTGHERSGLDCTLHEVTPHEVKKELETLAEWTQLGTRGLTLIVHRIQHLSVCLDVPDSVILLMLNARRAQ